MNQALAHGIWALVGPSGVGKSSLESALVAAYPGLQKGVSVTTRAPRPGERGGVDYHFVDADTFTRLEAEGALAQVVTIAGNRYGMSRAEVERKLAHGPLLAVVEPLGVRQFQAAYPGCVKSIYLKPPSAAALLARRIGRKDTPEMLADPARIEFDNRITAFEPEADFVIIADNQAEVLEKAALLMNLTILAA